MSRKTQVQKKSNIEYNHNYELSVNGKRYIACFLSWVETSWILHVHTFKFDWRVLETMGVLVVDTASSLEAEQ